ncbi:MAG TPA: hypothetical protein VIG29_18710, partial [Vicinamibacteria bacterium]
MHGVREVFCDPRELLGVDASAHLRDSLAQLVRGPRTRSSEEIASGDCARNPQVRDTGEDQGAWPLPLPARSMLFASRSMVGC